MFQKCKIQKLNDFFLELDKRQEKGIYFYRINGCNSDVISFIQDYYETARRCGAIIEGGISNPDEKSLEYYSEIIGMDFQLSIGFISEKLKKWLPRMNNFQCENIATAIYDSLDSMRKRGKTENMLKNAFIKIMCGLYYKFERIVNQLGMNKIPKILYEGYVNSYEMMLLSVLSNSGCDVVLLQYNGDAQYRKVDPNSENSYNLEIDGLSSFPPDFNIKWIRKRIENIISSERLYGEKPSVINCTNAWISGNGLEDVEKLPLSRGTDTRFFYNCFIRINGVYDKSSYVNELFKFYTKLKENKRNVVVVNNEIPKPFVDEVNRIPRRNYPNRDSMLMDISKCFNTVPNKPLQRLLVKSFIDVMLEEETEENNLNKLTNKAIYLMCWIYRYYSQLFSNWTMPNISCFILFGGCKNSNDAMFLKFLSKLPVDVVIFKPNLSTECVLKDKLLYDINQSNSLNIGEFPTDNSEIIVGTAAYHAERELDNIMYQDSGMYRNRQYSKAVAVTLQTMYEEIEILWNQELKYRPNFNTSEKAVVMPVIFAKVCGVKDGDVAKYWSDIKKLMVNDTFVVTNVPLINSNGANPLRGVVTEFLKNGKLQRQKIKSHRLYQYGFLREDVQEYILDKLQILIDQKLIKGTFENGMEYSIVANILYMAKNIVRMIQNFDFTKKNPKLLYIHTSENNVTVEDAILAAYLNLVGFDVLFFVPTGYQCVEKFYNKPILVEHQCGRYMYDLGIPDFRRVSAGTKIPWHKKIFGKRN